MKESIKEVAAVLFNTPGVLAVLSRRMATTEHVLARLVDAATLICAADPPSKEVASIMVALISGNTGQIVQAGSSVNVTDCVREALSQAVELAEKLDALAAEKEYLLLDTPPAPLEPVEPPASEPVVDPPAPVVKVEEPKTEEPQQKQPSPAVAIRTLTLAQLDIDGRARNALVKEGLASVGDIVDYKKSRPLVDIHNIGEDYAKEIWEAVTKLAEEAGISVDDL